MNKDRDNVSPSYLRLLRELTLNNTYQDLTPEDAKSAWITDALPNADPEAIKKIVYAIHGENAVIFDPSNAEASKKAVDEGRAVIHARQFTPEVWKAIREHDILKPAGQVIATEGAADPAGMPPILEPEWTDDMREMARYTKAVSKYLTRAECAVEFQNLRTVPTNAGTEGHFAAWYVKAGPTGPKLTFNLGTLGKWWPSKVKQVELDSLLIHELAHSTASDHLSPKFYETCCDFGAKLRCLDAKWVR